MTTTKKYRNILETIPPDINRRVMAVLEFAFDNSPGVNVTRQDMILNVFGVHVEKARLSSSTEDRQIREAIEDLQREGYPIISSSGKPGYRLAMNDEEKEAYIAELESRRRQLEEKIRALRNPRVKYVYREPATATQLVLV